MTNDGKVKNSKVSVVAYPGIHWRDRRNPMRNLNRMVTQQEFEWDASSFETHYDTVTLTYEHSTRELRKRRSISLPECFALFLIYVPSLYFMDEGMIIY
jgi:hypothetical protein